MHTAPTQLQKLSAIGLLALGCSVVLPTSASMAMPLSHVAGTTLSRIDASSMARLLEGEWEGQIEVRNSDGSLSTSIASMSAQRQPNADQIDMYYEGFAFDEPVSGAMIYSFDSRSGASVSMRDEYAGCQGSASSSAPEGLDMQSPSRSTFTMAGKANFGPGHRDEQVRVLFRKVSRDAVDIEFQSMNADGQWEAFSTLKLDRMDKGQRSAAAEHFASSKSLAMLRRQSAVMTASASSENDD